MEEKSVLLPLCNGNKQNVLRELKFCISKAEAAL